MKSWDKSLMSTVPPAFQAAWRILTPSTGLRRCLAGCVYRSPPSVFEEPSKALASVSCSLSNLPCLRLATSPSIVFRIRSCALVEPKFGAEENAMVEEAEMQIRALIADCRRDKPKSSAWPISRSYPTMNCGVTPDFCDAVSIALHKARFALRSLVNPQTPGVRNEND